MDRDIGLQCSVVVASAPGGANLLYCLKHCMREQRRDTSTAGLLIVLFTVACGGPREFVFTLPMADGVAVSFVAMTSDPDVLAAARAELKPPGGRPEPVYPRSARRG